MLSIVMGNPLDRKILLIVVLDKTNDERMKKGDPAELPLRTVPIPAGFSVENVTLLMCYEDELEEVLKLQTNPDGRVLLKYLCRGWTTQGDDGSTPVRLTRLQ
jgi:hypothetical protein